MRVNSDGTNCVIHICADGGSSEGRAQIGGIRGMAFYVHEGNTFATVDSKVAETEFFVQKLFSSNHPEFNYYLSAYLSASRTATFALQRFFHIKGFKDWYEGHRIRLQSDELAKKFLELRNDHVHGGQYPVSGSSHHLGSSVYFFKPHPRVGSSLDNIAVAARDNFLNLLQIVYDCYVVFGTQIDPQQHYTREFFATTGRGIDDAELEIWGWVCTHLIEDGFDEDDRWHELRGNLGCCEINHLFYSYLGKPTPQPVLPDHIADFDFSPEDKGWLHVPAGYQSLEQYSQR